MASTINVKIAPLPRGDYSSSATYAKLDVVSYNGSSYMAIKAVPTGTAPTNTTYWQLLAEQPTIPDGSITVDKLAFTPVTSVNGRTGDVTGLAENDGSYENMTVGNAEQLVSSTYVTDSAPYTFRTAGGSAEIGDRAYSEIVGGSIAWNQLVNDSDATYTANASSANYLTVSNNVEINANHVYIMACNQLGAIGTCSRNTMRIYNGSWVYENTATNYNLTKGLRYWMMKSAASLVTGQVGLWVQGTDVSVQYKDLQLFDLTQMFGSAVADYIYNMGSPNGVNFFKSLFPKPYYPYNAGTMIHVNASEHVTTGFNQWDEEWEMGGIDASGNNYASTTQYRSKNYIPVVSGQTYFCHSGTASNGNARFYDANKGWVANSAFLNATFTVPQNANFMRFYVTGTSYTDDICINLSWDGERNGEYEPYIEHTYPLDSSLTLRGAPKLVDSKLVYDGDIYEPDGTVTRKYGIVDLGSLSWNYQSSSGNMYADNAIPNRLVSGSTICAKYDPHGFEVGSVGGLTDDKQYAFQNTLTTRIIIKDSAYTNATTFTSAMDGVYLVYELDTPTTESADSYTNPFVVDDWGTEAFTVTEQSSVAMPVGHNTRYTSNLKAKLEMAPDSPSMGNGKYVVQHQNGLNEYVLLENEIPSVPTGTNATYVLKATVSGSTTTLSWVQE